MQQESSSSGNSKLEACAGCTPAVLWPFIHWGVCLISATATLIPCCCVCVMQHMSVKHLLKMMNVSNLSQPSQILVGE
jgi:hypothetical protein